MDAGLADRTSIPHTGSRATGIDAGADIGDDASTAPRPRAGRGDRHRLAAGILAGAPGDDLGEDRQGDLLGGAGSDLQPSRGPQPRPQRVGQVERVPHRIAADLAGDQSHIRHALTQGSGEDSLLVVPMRCDHHRRVAGTGLAVSRRAQLDGIADPFSEVGQRHCDRALSHHPDRRGGKARPRKISSAPPLRQGFLTVTAPSPAPASPSASPGKMRSKRLTRLQHTQRVQANRGLGASAADEALDGAIAMHDRRIAGPDGGWALGADDRRLDEGSARGDQLRSRARRALL